MTFKKIKTYVILVAFPLLLNSCASMSYIEIDVLRPAQYSMAPNVLSVVAVDFSYPHRSDSLHVFHVNSDTIVVDTLRVDDFGYIATQSMVRSLQEKAFFDSVYIYPSSLNQPPHGRKGHPIPAQEIRRITQEYNAQALIALEGNQYKSYVLHREFGSNIYYTSLDVIGELFWKVYDENGYILDAFLQKDSLFWNNSPLEQLNANQELPKIKDAIVTLAKFMGQEYPTRIAPYWETVYRPYYLSGHHMFERANDLVNINNWNQAGRVWYYVYENGNRKQKARATFNLALAFEVSGNFEESLAWAKRSHELIEQLSSLRASKKEKALITEYINELQQRIEDSNKLQEQLGGGF